MISEETLLHNPLEKKLSDIFRCVICLEVPTIGQVYQCRNGHLMCVDCWSRLLLAEKPFCPHCRVALTSENGSRNLAVEQAMEHLHFHCRYCSKTFSRLNFTGHEQKFCPMRPATCPFGCSFYGTKKEVAMHQLECDYLLREYQHFRKVCKDIAISCENVSTPKNFEITDTEDDTD